VPTAYGANSVASALGALPGATPARLCEHTMRVGERPRQEELSTWLGVGTFYLAPTPRSPTATGPSRRALAELCLRREPSSRSAVKEVNRPDFGSSSGGERMFRVGPCQRQ
jgi:hypothetical protein